MLRACLRTILSLLLLAAWQAQASEPTVPDTLEQRLLACASCHARVDTRGMPVNDSFFPRISGKPATYLYHQLINFKEGRRRYPLMNYLVAHLSDEYLLEIAHHFASQPPTQMPATVGRGDASVLARGRQLVLQGDPGRKLPACVACHGQRLTGVQPAIPGLLGLPPDYINAQFGAWRNKVRQAQAPDCMATIARQLQADEIAAISAWLATQTVPQDARPAPATELVHPLPLACGGVQERP